MRLMRFFLLLLLFVWFCSCFKVGITTAYLYSDGSKLFLKPRFTIRGNGEQILPVQACMNFLSTSKLSIILPRPGFQSLSSILLCCEPVLQLPGLIPFFTCPRPADRLSHLCLHKPSHPVSPAVNVTSFDLSHGYTFSLNYLSILFLYL